MRAHSLVPVGLLVGLVSGCAHSASSGGTRPGEPANTVTAEDIKRNPTVPIEELLTAKISGVWVTRTADGGIAVRIRGATSLMGNNEPLYIIDGIPILAGPNGGLAGVSPSDIESIEVVKDAAGMAMYGLQGANGVIVIKTKRPAH